MHAASVTLDPEIPPLSKCLYNVLTIFAGEKNSCFPSIETLVQVTGMSKDTVYKYLDILEECGVIERQHKRKSGQFRNTVYILCDENRKSPYTVITTRKAPYTTKSRHRVLKYPTHRVRQIRTLIITYIKITRRITIIALPLPRMQNRQTVESGKFRK